MSNKFNLKFNIYDVVVGVISIALVIILLIVNNTGLVRSKENTNNKVVYIYHKTKKLDECTTYYNSMESEEIKVVLKKEKYSYLLGDMTILINKEKGIRIADVTCPNHLCENTGWMNIVGMPIVCLPNDIQVFIQYSDGVVDNGIMME